MHQLEKAKYQTLRPLVSGLTDQGMVLSVLAGVRPGVVVVDDAGSPSAFCMGAPEGTFAWTYLGGSPRDRSFAKALNSWIFAEKGLGSDVGFSFVAVDTPEWEDALADVIAPRTVIPDRRLHYECTSKPVAWRDAIPGGYSIMDVDRSLLDSGIEMHPTVTAWLESNFGSAEGFLEHGVGAVAVHGGKVVGWILADSFIGDLCDIGGEVEEVHRGKRLAHAATCRTVELALDRGARRIGWHCHAINFPSVKTAEAAGFELKYEYRVYPIHFDREKHEGLVKMVAGEYSEAADAALATSNYQAADEMYTLALRLSDGFPSDTLHAAARAAAGGGNVDRAFELLGKAIESGGSSAQTTASQAEFSSLHQDPRWVSTLESLEQAS